MQYEVSDFSVIKLINFAKSKNYSLCSCNPSIHIVSSIWFLIKLTMLSFLFWSIYCEDDEPTTTNRYFSDSTPPNSSPRHLAPLHLSPLHLAPLHLAPLYIHQFWKMWPLGTPMMLPGAGKGSLMMWRRTKREKRFLIPTWIQFGENRLCFVI